MKWLRQRAAERSALVRCARALACVTYPDEDFPENVEARAAMHDAYRTLGVIDTRDLKPTWWWKP